MTRTKNYEFFIHYYLFIIHLFDGPLLRRPRRNILPQKRPATGKEQRTARPRKNVGRTGGTAESLICSNNGTRTCHRCARGTPFGILYRTSSCIQLCKRHQWYTCLFGYLTSTCTLTNTSGPVGDESRSGHRNHYRCSLFGYNRCLSRHRQLGAHRKKSSTMGLSL